MPPACTAVVDGKRRAEKPRLFRIRAELQPRLVLGLADNAALKVCVQPSLPPHPCRMGNVLTRTCSHRHKINPPVAVAFRCAVIGCVYNAGRLATGAGHQRRTFPRDGTPVRLSFCADDLLKYGVRSALRFLAFTISAISEWVSKFRLRCAISISPRSYAMRADGTVIVASGIPNQPVGRSLWISWRAMIFQVIKRLL